MSWYDWQFLEQTVSREVLKFPRHHDQYFVSQALLRALFKISKKNDKHFSTYFTHCTLYTVLHFTWYHRIGILRTLAVLCLWFMDWGTFICLLSDFVFFFSIRLSCKIKLMVCNALVLILIHARMTEFNIAKNLMKIM